jgi:hypothetical protein
MGQDEHDLNEFWKECNFRCARSSHSLSICSSQTKKNNDFTAICGCTQDKERIHDDVGMTLGAIEKTSLTLACLKLKANLVVAMCSEKKALGWQDLEITILKTVTKWSNLKIPSEFWYDPTSHRKPYSSFGCRKRRKHMDRSTKKSEIGRAIAK